MYMESVKKIINVIDHNFHVISYTVTYPSCDSYAIDPLISNGMTEYDLLAVSLQRGLFSISYNDKDWFQRTGPCSFV